MLLTGVVALLLLARHSLSAPQVTAGSQREESAEAPPPTTLTNPFGHGEDSRRLLQSYIKANMKKDQGGPEINTWEQEVFFLFSLHDYDRSGHMDGLEMMKFITDFNSHNSPGAQSADEVVSMVDFLLQTQDVNQDGLFAPSELLSPPIPHGDSDSHNAPPQQKQEAGEAASSEGKSPEPGGPEPPPPQQENRAEQVEQEGVKKEGQKQMADRQEVPQGTPVQEEQRQQAQEQKGPQIPEPPAAEQQQTSKQAPVHLGQPEM